MTGVLGRPLRQSVSVRIRRYDPTPEAAGLARRFVGNQLRRWDLDALVDDLKTITSELVTNAVREHSKMPDRPISVVIWRKPSSVTIGVADDSPDDPVMQCDDIGLPEDGRGLWIVDTLTKGRWSTRSKLNGAPGRWVYASLLIPCESGG